MTDISCGNGPTTYLPPLSVGAQLAANPALVHGHLNRHCRNEVVHMSVPDWERLTFHRN